MHRADVEGRIPTLPSTSQRAVTPGVGHPVGDDHSCHRRPPGQARDRQPTLTHQTVSRRVGLVGVGGAEGIRTPDLLIANETRYQLRHSPSAPSECPGGAGETLAPARQPVRIGRSCVRARCGDRRQAHDPVAPGGPRCEAVRSPTHADARPQRPASWRCARPRRPRGRARSRRRGGRRSIHRWSPGRWCARCAWRPAPWRRTSGG